MVPESVQEKSVNNGNTSPPLEKPSDDAEGKEKKVKKYYNTQVAAKNIWIIKPGENTNQGQGIKVAKEYNEIKDIIEDATNRIKRT